MQQRVDIDPRAWMESGPWILHKFEGKRKDGRIIDRLRKEIYRLSSLF